MRLIRSLLGWVVAVGLVSVPAPLAAQATGTTTFNAPYRAFTRSEIGVLLSFPNGGGTAIEGAYRMAGGRFDLGVKAGVLARPRRRLPSEPRFRRAHQRRARRRRGCVDRRRVGALMPFQLRAAQRPGDGSH